MGIDSGGWLVFDGENMLDTGIPQRGKAITPAWNGSTGGLFRSLVAGPSGRIRDVFANLNDKRNCRVLARQATTHSLAARLDIERGDGHGTWDLYRLDSGVCVVAGDFVYDHARHERVPGEDLLEFHLRLVGRLQLLLPGSSAPLVVNPDSLLVWRQPDGVEVTDRIDAGSRDTSVSIYCSVSHFRSLAARHGIAIPPTIAFAKASTVATAQYHLLPMNPGLLHIAHSLLRNPFDDGLRLLHAEAKVMELFCEVLHASGNEVLPSRQTSSEDVRRLDLARRILTTQYSPPPLIGEVARRVGMSETKLKRVFKVRFGMTVFQMSLEARMRHALELLRCKRMSVGQVAHAVGYSHQTSFASAFKQHFGFLPRAARQEA